MELVMLFEGFEGISSIVIDGLSKAGWERTTRSEESGVPEFVFNNGKIRISAFQSITDRSLILTLLDVDSGGYLRFDIQYGDSISLLLRILTTWQEDVSMGNFRDMVNEIALEFPETFAEPFDGDEDSPWQKVIPRS
ncbi:hypothetical protein [Streptomyces olivaceoviridis]|uniref:hypothetical protein n=1 Tax=Streptomyces olivaceoviridis TaxID=1921 RepID=UPI00331BE8A7